MKTKRLLQIKRKQIPQIIEIKVLHLQSRIINNKLRGQNSISLSKGSQTFYSCGKSFEAITIFQKILSKCAKFCPYCPPSPSLIPGRVTLDTCLPTA